MRALVSLTITEKWSSFKGNTDLYLEYHKLRFPYEKKFINNVRGWKFEKSFMDIRHEMSQISQDNRDRLKECDIIFGHPWGHNQDDVCLITDDDDWFNPAVVDAVKEEFEKDDSLNILYWKPWQYITAWEEGYNLNYPVCSNSFAVRGGMDKKLYSAGAHSCVKEMIKNGEDGIGYIDEPLSLWNIHPFSYYVMQTHEELPILCNSERKNRPAELDWASDEIERFYELISSVSLSAF